MQSKKFPLLSGFIDGILTALALCTGKMLEARLQFNDSLALRVSIAAFVNAGFVFFVVKYAELRAELIRAEKELNLLASGKLATTALGKKILHASMIDAVIAGLGAFIGAVCPLLISVVDPYLPWMTFLSALIALGVFGFILGKTVGRHALMWSMLLMLGGISVILLGIQLNIVS